MSKFSTNPKPAELPPDAQAFVDAMADAPRAPPSPGPQGRIQVAFRLPADVRVRLTRLSARMTMETGTRMTEQALFEEAIALLLKKHKG